MIRTIYSASDFLALFVKTLAGVCRRVLRERGIDAIKIAPHRLEYTKARHVNIIPQAQTPERFRQPRLQGSAASLLTF
jgi:hypothetical protein